MKCITCAHNYYKLYNSNNCMVMKSTYYINKTDSNIYPCSYLNQNCFECDPYMNTKGSCLSCELYYQYDNNTNECTSCGANEYMEYYEDFRGCIYSATCSLYRTNCIKIINDVKKNRTLFINWLDNKNGSLNYFINYPSYNFDNSNYLLIEFTVTDKPYGDPKTNKRKLYFYNEEGRGLFDEINDKYENIFEFEKKYTRYISSSIALKINNSEEYKYLINFENDYYNLELIDIKTGEIIVAKLLDLVDGYYYLGFNLTTQIIQLNEPNKFLIAKNDPYGLLYSIFSIDYSVKKKFNFNLINLIEVSTNVFEFGDCKFFFVQTKNGNLFVSYLHRDTDIGSYVYILSIYDFSEKKTYFISNIIKNNFHKFILIKEEIIFLCYYPEPNNNNLNFKIFDSKNFQTANYILESEIKTEFINERLYYHNDILFLSETKAALVIKMNDLKRITIYILNFFNNYKNYLINKFLLIIEEELIDYYKTSLLFKYKNILGLQIENKNGENGFILFGYYNSTDPKQILNIKKDGLNYNINLGDYLTLQSNIFEYEIKYIKIIEVPYQHESGLYFVSNISNKSNTSKLFYIKKNDFVDINTTISLYFSYNGTLKKGNYLFKFAGVLQEPEYDIVEKNSEKTFWNLNNDDIELKNKFIKEYNERRNFNIIGKVALVQINILDDIKVFCDKKYDESALKSEEGKLLTCGKGKFYDVGNAKEITQLNLGLNYYFDNIKNSYFKCHQRCKTCSTEYNNTNMNCDICLENYFLKDNNCFENFNCNENENYYYDVNYNLICIKKEISCPDFKPYEDKITKECITNCSIDELNNNICIPTNNLISINKTYKMILENINYLNIEEKILQKKEKYTIIGNNISFIFTSSEIEKKELYSNDNSSSIILNDLGNYLKKIYLIPDELPIPILKIEKKNNYSNNIELFYEFFNPLNLSEKLDLNSTYENQIEIRIPSKLKQYKMDLIIKAKNLGYNIFDYYDSFYNDICSVFVYNNSDISLSERKNIIDVSDEDLCLINCNYSNYDIYTLRSICLCKTGNENNINKVDDINKDKTISEENNLFYLFKVNMKNSNIKVIKCIKMIFRIDLFTKNYGFYIMLFMSIINIIILISSNISFVQKKFYIYCYEIINQMKTVYTNSNEENTFKNEDIKEKNKFQITKINTYQSYFTEPENNNNDKKRKINKIFINKIKKRNFFKMRTNNNIKINSQLKTTNISQDDKTEVSFTKKKENEISKNIIDENKIIRELKLKKNSDFYIYLVIKYISFEDRRKYLSESEITNLSYKYALEIEDRTESKYYFSLLKQKNKVISMILNDKDYNIKSVKVSSFFFNFNLTLTITALFYNDAAIHQINQDEGIYNLKSEFSRVLYSALISAFINFIIETLSFTHENIIKLRYYKDYNEAKNEIPKLVVKLKLKYVIFFVITIFLNIIFFYYITAFCAIYSIIQTHMIKDALISFLLTMSYSIILSLISSIIRIFSLQKESKFRHFLYIISWLISLI